MVGLILAQTATPVACRVVRMDRADGRLLSVLLPPGDLRLVAPLMMGLPASQAQWVTSTPPGTHPLLCIRPLTRLLPAWRPFSTRGLSRRTLLSAFACAST